MEAHDRATAWLEQRAAAFRIKLRAAHQADLVRAPCVNPNPNPDPGPNPNPNPNPDPNHAPVVSHAHATSRAPAFLAGAAVFASMNAEAARSAACGGAISL